MSGRLATLLSLLAVALAGAAYAASLSGDYVYDDVRFVERNPAVQGGAPVGAYFLDPATQTGDASWQGLWRPLRTLSFRAVRWFGAGPGPQRFANLLIHLGNGMLVYLLLRRLLRSGRAALIGALAFVLHPLAAEPVAWISGRGDLLALTGMLAAVLLHDRGGRAAAAASVVAFALALLAKESAVALPLLLVAMDGFRGGWRRIAARWQALAAHGTVLVLYLGARAAVLGGAFGQAGGRDLSEGLLAVSLLGAGFYYLRALVLPAGLTFELHLPTGIDAPWLPVAGLAAAAGLAFLAWRLRRRAPAVTLAVLWLGAVLLPVTAAQLLFPLKILVANRFAYPAVVAGALALAWIASRGPRYAALAAVAVLAFAPLSAARAETFSTPRRLWTSVIERDPDNAVALLGLGTVKARAERWAEAEALLRRSVAADPRHPEVAALHGEALEHLATEAEDGSAREHRFLQGAFDAYHVAIRTWQGGVEEGRSLYRPTLVNAAWLALLVGRVDLAIDHVKSLLASDEPIPPEPAVVDLMIVRLRVLASEFARGGQSDAAAGLLDLREELKRERSR